MTSVLGFAARIGAIDHPAALFKFSGTNGYCWSAMLPSNGHLISIWPTRETFSGVIERHSSYHHNGFTHQTVNGDHINRHPGLPISNIRTWKSLKSVSVPLDVWFPWEMEAKPWSAVKCPYILRRDDFGGADGVMLHGFICKTDQVDVLIHRWRVAKQHWIAGNEDLRLVVLAEPLFSQGRVNSALQ
jgi:hypothetical protein